MTEPTRTEDPVADARALQERARAIKETARLGGSEKSRQKQVDAGKMLVRDRLAMLFDDGVEVEDGLLTRMGEDLPGDAVVTAFGKVHGRPVAVIATPVRRGSTAGLANDPSSTIKPTPAASPANFCHVASTEK